MLIAETIFDDGLSPTGSVTLFAIFATSKMIIRSSPLRMIVTFVHRAAFVVANLPINEVSLLKYYIFGYIPFRLFTDPGQTYKST